MRRLFSDSKRGKALLDPRWTFGIIPRLLLEPSLLVWRSDSLSADFSLSPLVEETLADDFFTVALPPSTVFCCFVSYFPLSRRPNRA